MTDKEQIVRDFYTARDEVPKNLQHKGDWITTDTHIFRIGVKGGKPYISAVSLVSHDRALKHNLHV
jgi:hypothetical protein